MYYAACVGEATNPGPVPPAGRSVDDTDGWAFPLEGDDDGEDYGAEDCCGPFDHDRLTWAGLLPELNALLLAAHVFKRSCT